MSGLPAGGLLCDNPRVNDPTAALDLPDDIRSFFQGVIEGLDPDEHLGTDPVAVLVGAMRDVTSLWVMQTMLHEWDEDLAFSAGKWHDFLNKRIRPAIETRKLSIDNLAAMLHEAEEYGRQHVLLYKLKRGFQISPLLSLPRVRRQLHSHKKGSVLDAIPSASAHDKLDLVHVRLDDKEGLVLKAVESKESLQVLKTYNVIAAAGHEIRVGVAKKKRRIKLARLRPNGLLEVRLSTVSTGGRQHNYQKEATEFLELFSYLIEPSHFSPARLDKFRKKIWEVRDEDRIVIPTHDGAAATGERMTLRARDRRSDVSTNIACGVAYDAFMKVDGSTPDQAEIVWKRQETSGAPSTDVVVRLSGASSGVAHEFSIRQHCTRADFEYVLAEIRKYGGL